MEHNDQLMGSRNHPYSLALRTKKNLGYILDAHEKGADVHPVTQVTCSLMGIVVFPWEQEHKLENSKCLILEVFNNPPLEINYLRGKVTTFGCLWKLVRNAVSHGHVEFGSDSRDLEKVEIKFSSGYRKDGSFKITKAISMRGDHLLTFCYGVLDYIK